MYSNVEIVIEPCKRLIIHEIIEYKFDDLIKIPATGFVGGMTPPLYWANGVVFVHSVFADTDVTVQERIKGTIHWTSVIFALKPNYERQVTIKETNTTVPIVDVSTNEIFIRLSELLKQRSKYTLTGPKPSTKPRK